METMPRSIPRPLVRANQWVIVLSVIAVWLTGWEWLLLIPLLSGLGGLLFDFNPVMRAGEKLLRKEAKNYIPEDWEQQQFNQKLAVFFLAGGLISYLAGWEAGGYAFTIMVGLAAFIAILGFCIGCFMLFQWKRFVHQRAK